VIRDLLVLIGLLGALASCRCGPDAPAAWLDTVQPAEPRRALRGWALHRADGSPFDEGDLVGRTSLVFVGYTRCPDVCPTTLSLLCGLGELDPPVRVVFLSVDPEHDRAGLADYTRHFDEDIVGITGSREAVDHAVAQLGAAYAFRDGRVDHSTSLFVVDANANVAGFVLRPSTVEGVQRDLAALRSHRPPRLRADLTAPPAPPGAPGVVYGTLGAPEAATITALSSPDVDRVELHRTVHRGPMSGMQPVDVLQIGPDAPVELAPGGLHLMLLGERRAAAPILDVAFEDGGRALVPTGVPTGVP